MDAATQDDLLSYYERHFHDGMVDLSESSPPPVEVPGGASQRSLAYQGLSSTAALRQAIAARYETLGHDDIVVTNGASEALAAVAMSVLRCGDRLFACPGAYPTFTGIANLVGAMRADSPGTAGVVLLANPTIPGGQLVNVAGYLSRSAASGARVVVDEVYRDLAIAGRRITAACDIDPRAVSIGDLSKPLGLGGLRIGWVASRDRALLVRVRRMVQLLSGGPAAPSLAVAERALEAFDTLTAPLVESARALAARTYGLLREHGWSFTPAVAGLTVLARPPRPLAAAALQQWREGGWFLLPSEVFGSKGGFRVSLMQPDALAAALATLERMTFHQLAKRTLVVLTKNPGTGTAKTRLARDVGPAAACAFAHAFVRDTLSLASSGPWQTTVAVSAPGATDWLRRDARSATFVEQPAGDLGERIGAAIEGALQQAGRVALVASDTPDLPPEFVVRAFDELNSADIVVGPARDGGFYLLAARVWRHGLLARIEWSTGTVCERLLANARRLRLRYALLTQWEDVDDIESLRRLAARLEAGGTAPATAAALRAWRREASLVT